MQTFTHDDIDQLTGITHNLPGTTNDLTQTFTYNTAGQIASAVKSNDAYAYTGYSNHETAYTNNGLNQTTQEASNALTWDANGNLASWGGQSYTFTKDNLLKTAPGGVNLVYDAMSRLSQVNVTGAPDVGFGYSGLNLIGEYDRNNGNALLRRYVHGPGIDNPIVWYEGTGTSDRRFLLSDERGSVIAVTNSSGGLIQANTYDEHGVPGTSNLGRFQYTGQTWIDELGLYYYKARFYAPTLGKFINTDPIRYGGGLNMYNYVGGDPVNFVDPLGLARKQWFGGKEYIWVCVGLVCGWQATGNEGPSWADQLPSSPAPFLLPTVPERPDVPEIPQFTCHDALQESGLIVANQFEVNAANGNVSGGSWKNLRTGTTGLYTTVGAGGGAEVGVSAQFAMYPSLSAMNGTGTNIQVSGLFVGSISISETGEMGWSGGVGGSAGTSSTVTHTEIYNCKEGGSDD